MKRVISLIVLITILFASFGAYALNIKSAYKQFKTAHPDFINSLIAAGISEDVIVSFINDVYDYLMEMDKYTPITKTNFESNAIKAITDVSSREAYYSFQDVLIELYPDAIKLALKDGKVHKDFQPLVATIKKILFPEGGSGSGSGPSSSPDSGSDKDNNNDSKEEEITPSQPKPRFTDISQSHWAYTAISYLSDNFILNGYLDGTFKPENNITRAEFAKIIVSATDSFDDSQVSEFNDVSDSDWYYSYVSTAYKLGYITGYPDGSFRPNDNITRADICTIVNRVLKATPSNSTVFTDDQLIPEYAKDAVYALSAKGIINGYSDGTFAPTTYATRAQTAKIIYSAFFQK